MPSGPGTSAPRAAALVVATTPAPPSAFSPCWAPVKGRPLVTWTLDCLAASPHLSDVLVLAPEGRRELVQMLAARSGWRNVRALASPVASLPQAAPLLAALAHLDATVETFVFVDAAQPLLRADSVHDVLTRADATQVAIAAVPVKETIKWADEARQVRRTLPRSSLWQLQTPAAVPRATLTAGLRQQMASPGAAAHSDLVSWLLATCAGVPVRVVPAGPDAPRVRTRADLDLLAGMLRTAAAH